MILGKKKRKESLLASVVEDRAAETEGDRELVDGGGSRLPSRQRRSQSQGSVDQQQTVTWAEADLCGQKDQHSVPVEEVLDRAGGGQGREDEEDEEDGEGGKGRRESVVSDEDYDTDLELGDEQTVYNRTGQTCYMEVCRVLQVVPASYFLRHMQSSELSMVHHGLGPQGTKALAVSLVTNTFILRLNLRDNWMEAVGGASLAEMLKENCYITEVDVSDNNLGEHGASAMSSMLQENTTLTSLNLSGNRLNDRAAQHLSQALTVNTKLETLDLSHNSFREAAGEALEEALSENTGLRSLSLAWNSIRGRGAVALARGVGANIFIRTLDLSYNGLGREGAITLGEALKENNSLEELDISNNRIPPEGAIRFAVGLKVNKTIKCLKMARNPILTAGCYGILKSIESNPESAMETLDFSDITVNQDFEDLFSAVKEIFPALTVKHGGRIDTFKKTEVQVLL